jgi:hypothetical protein
MQMLERISLLGPDDAKRHSLKFTAYSDTCTRNCKKANKGPLVRQGIFAFRHDRPFSIDTRVARWDFVVVEEAEVGCQFEHCRYQGTEAEEDEAGAVPCPPGMSVADVAADNMAGDVHRMVEAMAGEGMHLMTMFDDEIPMEFRLVADRMASAEVAETWNESLEVWKFLRDIFGFRAVAAESGFRSSTVHFCSLLPCVSIPFVCSWLHVLFHHRCNTFRCCS